MFDLIFIDELFEIDEDTAEITVKKPLSDYDKKEYNLVIKAVQVDNPLRTALSLINIKLIELNRHPPLFESTNYTVKLFENTAMDTLIIRLHATDLDNNRLIYLIEPSSEGTRDDAAVCPFRLDKYTGELRVNGRLDFEMKNKYVINVLVSDMNFTARSEASDE